jgi:hypothetical protein
VPVLLLILISVLAGLLALVAVIFTIISFANSGKNKFTWLIIFIASLLGLFVSVFFAASRAAKSTREFVTKMSSPYDYNDSIAKKDVNFADSVGSKQLRYLRLIEPSEYKGNVPPQFYNYLGYRDYYRLPLKYPYSLHCEGYLEKSSLFNEEDVEDFGVNDNGERDCNINNIMSFAFDGNILYAKCNRRELEVNEDYFVIFDFKKGKAEKFNTEEKAEQRAKELEFQFSDRLTSCKDYYQLLVKRK